MRNFGFFLLSLWFFACTPQHSGTACSLPTLPKEAIIKIVNDEMKRKGGDPTSITRSKINIKREGCEYIYHQVYLPKRPGGYLFVRIDETGKIIEWAPGL